MAKPALLVNKPYVEIGGVKWATMNIGANSETDYGLYFQWGDTAGYTSSQVGANTAANKKPFTWADCALHNGTTASTEASLTKYNGTNGDALCTLEQCDDAAAANWGGDWRMPTIAEIVELTANTTSTWQTNYNGTGVSGRLFTSISNPNIKLFFPAAGYCNNATVNYTGSIGLFWSSSLYTSNGLYGRYLYFNNSNVNTYYSARYFGQSVRPVYDPT